MKVNKMTVILTILSVVVIVAVLLYAFYPADSDRGSSKDTVKTANNESENENVKDATDDAATSEVSDTDDYTDDPDSYTYSMKNMSFDDKVYQIEVSDRLLPGDPISVVFTDKNDIDEIISGLNACKLTRIGEIPEHTGGASLCVDIYLEDRELMYMIDFHPDYVESGFHKYTSENSDDVIEEFRTKLLEMYKSRLTEDEQALVDRYESMAANG